MKRFISVLLFFIILLSSFTPLADDMAEYKENTLDPLEQFAAFEGIMAGLSWLGTTDFAGVFVITHPWALAEALHDSNDTLFYTGVVSAEALAIYSISLDKDKYSSGERFRKNMIAWHVFFGVVGVTDWLTGGDGLTDWFAQKEDEAVALSFSPLHDGGKLNASFRY